MTLPPKHFEQILWYRDELVRYNFVTFRGSMCFNVLQVIDSFLFSALHKTIVLLEWGSEVGGILSVIVSLVWGNREEYYVQRVGLEE